MGYDIQVAVIDDGLDFTHEDLTDNVMNWEHRNYHLWRSSIYNPVNTHGTAVASIIAARDNLLGVRGVAPRAKIYGYNLLAGAFSSDNLAKAMNPKAPGMVIADTAVANNSWSVINTRQLKRAPAGWTGAVETGIDEGYDGNGVFYVFSAGNGDGLGDYSNLSEIAKF